MPLHICVSSVQEARVASNAWCERYFFRFIHVPATFNARRAPGLNEAARLSRHANPEPSAAPVDRQLVTSVCYVKTPLRCATPARGTPHKLRCVALKHISSLTSARLLSANYGSPHYALTTELPNAFAQSSDCCTVHIICLHCRTHFLFIRIKAKCTDDTQERLTAYASTLQ